MRWPCACSAHQGKAHSQPGLLDGTQLEGPPAAGHPTAMLKDAADKLTHQAHPTQARSMSYFDGQLMHHPSSQPVRTHIMTKLSQSCIIHCCLCISCPCCSPLMQQPMPEKHLTWPLLSDGQQTSSQSNGMLCRRCTRNTRLVCQQSSRRHHAANVHPVWTPKLSVAPLFRV